MYKKCSSKKGAALLMALGILALLSVVGASFATNIRLMQSTTKNFVYEVQARYLAEAGIEYAIAQLKYGDDGVVANAIDSTTESWNPPGYSDNTLLSGNGSYSVSVTDCASQIYLNDSNPNLEQMLKNLRDIPGAGLSLTDADCANIANNAPYLTKEEIKRISGIGDTKYNDIKDYITVNSYIDPYVVDPLDFSIDEDPPTPYEFQPRAPININTASQEVLETVLTGIRAVNACPNCGGDGELYDTGILENNQPDCAACDGGDLEITDTEATAVASFIVNNRPYKSWAELYYYYEDDNEVVLTPRSIKNAFVFGEQEDVRDDDLILAGVNPNTGFSWIKNAGWADHLGYMGKYLLNYDKDAEDAGDDNDGDKGLVAYTTEFSFNSGGYYEITATGEVTTTAPGSPVTLASKEITTIVKIFDIFRETTQEQFENGTKTNVQTYPEPVDAEIEISSASYDGQIMLARKASTDPDSGTHFRADYSSSLDAESAGTPSILTSYTGAPTIGSVVSTSSRGELMPDGMLSDNFDSVRPMYSPVDNISEEYGTVEIWFKTMYKATDTRIFGDSTVNQAEKKLFRFTSKDRLPDFPVEPYGVQYLTFFIWSSGGDPWVQAEGSRGYWDSDEWNIFTEEDGRWLLHPGYVFWQSNTHIDPWNAGEWNQLVLTWDNALPGSGPDKGKGDPISPNWSGGYTKTNNPIDLYFNGSRRIDGGGSNEIYYYHTPYGIPSVPSLVESRMMMIGTEDSKWNNYKDEYSDSIICRVRMWDYELDSDTIADNYDEGIFESSGTFTSSTFDPGQNVEWGTVTWTEAIPDEVNDDIQIDLDTGSGFTGEWDDDPESDNVVSGSSNSLQYRVTFSASSTALKDTPVLEDISVTYMAPTKILYWREN